jgi:glycosyltransferase involved in cell wall biosynthesis
MPPERDPHADIGHLLTGMVEPDWYLQRYPDIAAMNLDPAAHFREYGPSTRRDPNRFFDSGWYATRYPEVAESGLDPVIHYLRVGATAGLDPHPRFDAAWYVHLHPEATANPVLYHLRTGLARGHKTEKPIDIRDFLPSEAASPTLRPGVFVDVIVPALTSIEQAQRCLAPILAGRSFPLARVIVFDHAGSDRLLSTWLDALAADGEIHLIRERRRPRHAASIIRGVEAAHAHDVVLLNGDTRISAESLRRLAAYAWSDQQIATVSAVSDDGSSPGCGLFRFGRPEADLEATCRSVNAGRMVPIPTAIGGCIYIRHDALRAAGGLTDGPDPVADFCQVIAASGWQHGLALDTFAGRDPNDDRPAARALGSFATDMDRDRATGAGDPFRFAVTAAVFRRSGLPVILMVSHNLGGGIRRHINSLAQRYAGRAHVLLLAGTDRGAAVSVPLEPDHPVVTLPPDRIDDMIKLLRSAGVTRLHIHHLLYQALDVRRLIHRLDVKFDVTVHDYYAICPQVNLLPWPEGIYCGEPDRAGCNRCIAEFSSHHAKDILSWRGEQAWQFVEADRVICPSEDVRTRLSQYGAGSNALVVPHEQPPPGDWPVTLPDDAALPLRIVLLGVLANHKGARIVASVAEAAEPGSLAIHLIGHLEASFPKPAAKFINATGQYHEAELASLLDQAKPQVFWFPSTSPETYSYTLTTAIESGLPIVATRIGSFPERLTGRPNTWLVDYNATTQDWLAAFDDVRMRLRTRAPTPRMPRPTPVSAFYADQYLAPKETKPARRTRPRIAVLPERLENGALTTSAYVRLLQSLDHPSVADAFEILLVDAETVFGCAADIVVTQRHAIQEAATADRLSAYVRRIGAALIFDLDDDLLHIVGSHPARTAAVRRMLTVADAVWLSTQGLADRLATIRTGTVVVEDRLDERIWTAPPTQAPYWDDPIRILYLRTGTPDNDLAMIEPVLTRLATEYGDRLSIDVLASVRPRDLPRGINGIGPSANASRSYPGLVDWMTRSRPVWHIGLAPLVDTAFNQCRSPVKALDYAAMGLAILASDTPAYRDSLADGPGGWLVPNTPAAWHAALDWLIRDQDLRRRLAVQARQAFVAGGTLTSAAQQRLAALRSVLPPARLRDGSAALTMSHGQSHPAPRTRRRGGRGR